MKKCLIIFILLLALTMPNMAFSTNDFKVIVNGQEIQLSTVPIVEEKIIWVPIRSIFESLGSQVKWQPIDSSILSIKRQKKIWLQVNSDKVRIDEKEFLLDAPVKTISGTALIPLSFVAKAFPVKIEVNKDSNQIIINNSSYGLILTSKSHILIEPKSGLILLRIDPLCLENVTDSSIFLMIA